MNIWEAILLGLVQGLTEFLPISSSGHLVLFQNILGVQGDLLFFDVMLHVGTLAAVFTVFFRDIIDLFKPPFKTMGCLIIATLPAGIVMLLLSDQIEALFGGQFLWIGFLITALLLLATEFIGKKYPRNKPLDLKVSLIMGVSQAVAIVPGISRSGATISGGVYAGAKRETVAKFSFLMSIPVILGSGFFEIIKVQDWNAVPIVCVIAGMIAAGLSGFLAIKLMLRLIQKCNYKWFSLYLIVLALVSCLNQYVFSWW
ncbi:MAG TPA: undecaprenyl-diphosphate phosphatase [Clostridia bacterium]|jgi:undecaprenyl-diphosphatase